MTQLHAIRLGDAGGPPTLLLHGITGHARRWEHLATGPWSHRDVLAVDLRGHGSSTWDAPWSVPQLVDDVVETLDGAGLATVDVVGHSYGGLLALHLLARAPERVRRVVMLDPGLLRDGAEMQREAESMIAIDGYESVEAAVAARMGDLDESLRPVVLREVEQHLVVDDPSDGTSRVRFRYSRPMVVTALGEMCRPLPVVAAPRPTLLVEADRDRIVLPHVVAGLESLLGDHLERVTMPCGHMVYWEMPEETASIVSRFLETPPPSRDG